MIRYSSLTTAEVATQLVALCREGRFLDAVKTLYADDIVSVEAMDYQGVGREMRGKEAVLAKNVGWFKDNDVHSASVTGPFVSPEKFAVWYSFEWTKSLGRADLWLTSEVAYTGTAEDRYGPTTGESATSHHETRF